MMRCAFGKRCGNSSRFRTVAPRKRYRLLVLVSYGGKVSGAGRQQPHDLFLNVVGVLKLVDHHIVDTGDQRLSNGLIGEQVVHQALLMREVDPIRAE